MVYISETIVDRVKEAKNEQELSLIIDQYTSGLKIKSKNGRIDKKYTRNILVALKYRKTQQSEPGALSNINRAIEIIKELHAQATENVF
jgi:hypothetical protein